MLAALTRQLNASYLDVGRMPYGEALVANLRFAKLDQDRVAAMRDARS